MVLGAYGCVKNADFEKQKVVNDSLNEGDDRSPEILLTECILF